MSELFAKILGMSMNTCILFKIYKLALAAFIDGRLNELFQGGIEIPSIPPIRIQNVTLHTELNTFVLAVQNISYVGDE